MEECLSANLFAEVFKEGKAENVNELHISSASNGYKMSLPRVSLRI